MTHPEMEWLTRVYPRQQNAGQQLARPVAESALPAWLRDELDRQRAAQDLAAQQAWIMEYSDR